MIVCTFAHAMQAKGPFIQWVYKTFLKSAWTEKGIISKQDFDNVQLRYNQSKLDVSNAISDLQIIRSGSKGGAASANTNIRATVPGTVLEIPVEEGFQVIASNSFNAGTTIATIADLNKMIFEGKVDEAEVGKLKVGMPLEVSLGAIEDQALQAKLKFIAPKGNEEQGAVQFKIEADLYLNDSIFIRAGYSANASLVLQRKDSVMAISESLLQFDRKTEEPYVEIEIEDQKFERRDVKIILIQSLIFNIWYLAIKSSQKKIGRPYDFPNFIWILIFWIGEL